MRARTAVLLVLLAAVGCASAGGFRSLRGEGVTRFYEAPFEAVWEAALQAVEANGLRLETEDRQEGLIVASRLPSGRSMAPDESVAVTADQGERIAIFVDSARADLQAVEVVNRRRFALDPDVTDWTEDVFWVIEHRLGGDARVAAPRSAAPDSAVQDSTDRGAP